MIHELEYQHNLVEQLIIGLNSERLEEKVSWRFATHMPTLADLLYFMCISHENMHLGQLAAWRRAIVLPSVLGKMD